MMPYFSVVIPTRNRPHFLKYALTSLQQQSFEDFEVIVSDNSDDDHKEAVALVQGMNDPRFKVVCTPSVLSMSDNFNYGVSHASGRYISTIADKTLLLPGALKKVHSILSKDPSIDVINWLSDWYGFKDEGNSWEGFYMTQQDFYEPMVYDLEKELKFRLSFLIKRAELKRRYFRGQIYYGFYSRELIEKIKQKVGKVFYDLNPDHTSLLFGFLYSKKSYDIGMPLSMMFVTKLSNGNKGQENLEEGKKYLSQSLDCPFEKFLEKLPFSPFYQAITNVIAYDFIRMLDLTGHSHLKKYINYGNLSLRVLEEMQGRFPPNYKKVILDTNPGSDLLKNLFIKKVQNVISKTFSEFNREEIRDNFLMRFAKYFQNTGLYAQKQRQRNAYFAQPCSDPLAGLEYGHAHYSQFPILNYQ